MASLFIVSQRLISDLPQMGDLLSLPSLLFIDSSQHTYRSTGSSRGNDRGCPSGLKSFVVMPTDRLGFATVFRAIARRLGSEWLANLPEQAE